MLLILRGMLLTAQHFSSSKISPRRGSSSVTRPSGVKKAPLVKMILCVCKNSSQNRASLMLLPSNQAGIPSGCLFFFISLFLLFQTLQPFLQTCDQTILVQHFYDFYPLFQLGGNEQI